MVAILYSELTMHPTLDLDEDVGLKWPTPTEGSPFRTTGRYNKKALEMSMPAQRLQLSVALRDYGVSTGDIVWHPTPREQSFHA